VEWLSNPIAAEGAALYVGIAVVLGVGGTRLWDWYSEDDDEEVAFSDLLDEETLKDGKAERQLLDDIAESHKTITAPAAIEWDTRAARVGEQWTTTLYITEYPDYPNDGYLSDLFELTDVQFDLTAHITPKNQERARNELQDIADDLQVDADLEQSIRSAYLQERANEAAATYKAVENGANVFDQGMFITVRADEKDDLRDAVQTVKSALRDDPANLTPKTAICRQDLALQSAAPIGDNEFGRTSIALGGAVGAMLSSPQRDDSRRGWRRIRNSQRYPESGRHRSVRPGERLCDVHGRGHGLREVVQLEAKLHPLDRAEQGPYRHHPRTAEQLGRRLRGARRQANHGRRDTRSEPSGDSGDARTRPASDG